MCRRPDDELFILLRVRLRSLPALLLHVRLVVLSLVVSLSLSHSFLHLFIHSLTVACIAAST